MGKNGSRWISWAKMEYTCEVYGLFAEYINQGADTGMSTMKRQEDIPDFTISSTAGRPKLLGELKLNGQSKTFFPSDKKEGDRCSGVGKRAGMVNSDYLRNSRRADIDPSCTLAYLKNLAVSLLSHRPPPRTASLRARRASSSRRERL